MPRFFNRSAKLPHLFSQCGDFCSQSVVPSSQDQFGHEGVIGDPEDDTGCWAAPRNRGLGVELDRLDAANGSGELLLVVASRNASASSRRTKSSTGCSVSALTTAKTITPP